jgi:L-arabinokinase
MKAVWFVSGHGHGHARRVSQILKALTQIQPDWCVHVRTTAPAEIFGAIPNVEVSAPVLRFDSGAIEDDVFTINPQRTIQAVRDVLGRKEEIIAQELRVLKAVQPKLILADIPYLAGDIAERTGLPCIGVSNFTWDFVYEPMLADDPDCLLEAVHNGYRKMHGLIRLQMRAPVSPLPILADVPGFVVQRSRLSKMDILSRLGLLNDSRPKVLFFMRGDFDRGFIGRAIESCPGFLFILPNLQWPNAPKNTAVIQETPELMFPEMLGACDVVISKIGSGIISDAIANETRMLYPKKTWFREDEVTAPAMHQHGVALEMPLEDYRTGHWRVHLEKIMALPANPLRVSLNGAEEAAELILRFAPH